ncbi:MAG: glucokinase [Gammaproteobacteria bacterium]|nr:glucokinase [Gammaproteobacteria bacterium]
MKIIAGDIGGTKTLLQLADNTNGQITIIHESRYDSQAAVAFDEVLTAFLKEARPLFHGDVESMCIGVAGPISGNTAKVTNLPWLLDTYQLSHHFGISNVRLINDFQAIGYGIEGLNEADLVVLQRGRNVEHGARAIIGAGTGLGCAMLVWRGGHYDVLPSEGGHADFSPATDVQIELLQFLRCKYNAVSIEHVLSGPGLDNIFDFFKAKAPAGVSDVLAQAIEASGVAPAITTLGAGQGGDTLAAQVLTLFVQIYGAIAGNLALMSHATGGVYISGGIAPRIMETLKNGEFIAAFNRKSKMQHLLETIPVSVVSNPQIGLLGAALVASRL